MPSEVWDLTGSVVLRAKKEALTIRHERTNLAASSALLGPRPRAISAPAVFVTCMRETSRAKASRAMSAIGHCQNAVERITPQRKKLESKKNPLRPSGCNAANAARCVNQKEMGKQTPRSCLRVGGDVVSDRDMMVITGATSAGLRSCTRDAEKRPLLDTLPKSRGVR